MENKLYILKEKMVEKYEEYKKEHKNNEFKVIGFQDCMIELLKNITMEIENDKKNNK